LTGVQACANGAASASSLNWWRYHRHRVATATVRFSRRRRQQDRAQRFPDTIAHVDLQGSRFTLDCRGSARFRRVNVSGSVKLSVESLNPPELALSISGHRPNRRP
jgi:hypothetical protein